MATPLTQGVLVGQKLGHYRIVEKIGSGAMGVVYRGYDEHLDRDVAIKVLPPGTLEDAKARERFRREALMLSKLNHPNIAIIHDFDSRDSVDFLVTEYVGGLTIAEKIAQGPLSEAQIIQYGIALVEGLAAAHAKGLAHRDLKPANLRLTSDGTLKILDFGLATTLLSPDRVETISTTGDDRVCGTLLYMSPEQLRGQPADCRADIYGAGAVLYEMATGRVPFDEHITAVLTDLILHRTPTPPSRFNPSLSPRIDDVILRCLEKSPDHRYQSALDLRADLLRCSVAASMPERSVAVLYFDNLSAAVEQEYFRDGITEDIITELSKIRDLRVFARSAVLVYREKPVTPAYVGQQLNAAYVVEGSVRRDADQLRITAKLVEARTGHALWAERYDRELKDVFAIQDEIAHSIAQALRVVLTEKEKKAIEKVPTTDVRAYDYYLQGRQFFLQFRRKGLSLGREMFARAIEIDPNYARAYAGIAYCLAFLYMYWDSNAVHLQQAEEASSKALGLDPDLAEAHCARGLVASLLKQHEEAQRELEIAIRLNPRLFEPYYFYGRSYYSQGEFAKAIDWFNKASEVLPEDYQALMLMASALNGLGRHRAAEIAYRRGLSAAEKHLELYPVDTRALYFGANALSQLHEKDRAVKWLERAMVLAPDEPQVLYNVACVFALMGETEKAIDCLENSITGGFGQREWIEHDPDLESVRQHPRFAALMTRSPQEIR